MFIIRWLEWQGLTKWRVDLKKMYNVIHRTKTRSDELKEKRKYLMWGANKQTNKKKSFKKQIDIFNIHIHPILCSKCVYVYQSRVSFIKMNNYQRFMHPTLVQSAYKYTRFMHICCVRKMGRNIYSPVFGPLEC